MILLGEFHPETVTFQFRAEGRGCIWMTSSGAFKVHSMRFLDQCFCSNVSCGKCFESCWPVFLFPFLLFRMPKKIDLYWLYQGSLDLRPYFLWPWKKRIQALSFLAVPQLVAYLVSVILGRWTLSMGLLLYVCRYLSDPSLLKFLLLILFDVLLQAC